jgi:hypothetical protein
MTIVTEIHYQVQAGTKGILWATVFGCGHYY